MEPIAHQIHAGLVRHFVHFFTQVRFLFCRQRRPLSFVLLLLLVLLRSTTWWIERSALDVRAWPEKLSGLNDWHRATERAIHLLHNAASRERGLHHHQFAHVLRREQTDQAFHAVEHGHCWAMALLHDAERFFKACAGGNGGNIAPHHITHANLRIIFAQSGNEIVSRQNARDISVFIDNRKVVLRGCEKRVHRFLQGRSFWKRAEFAYHCARNRKSA